MSGVQVPAPLLFLSEKIRDTILIQRLFSFCKSHQLISPNDTVFVAISGGMDSVALLDSLLELNKNMLPINIKAIHVNHGIRGAEAARDEHFVRSFCADRKVELEVVHLQGLHIRKDEATLREARYQAFETLLSKHPRAKLATAHTLDDNVETLIMRLAKGSSLKGLRGIPVKRGAYIRPFLFLTRAEIQQYVQSRKLSFVQDSSNASLNYLRNRIRHQLLPVFKEIFGEQFYAGMGKSLQEINAFYNLFEKEFARLAEETLVRHPDKIEIDLQKYKYLDILYRYRLIDYCISAFYPLNYSFSKTYMQRIDRFIRLARVGAVLNAYEDVRFVKDRQVVIVTRVSVPPSDVLLSEPLKSETKVRFGAFEIGIRKVSLADVKFSEDKNVEFICGDSICFPLVIRHWQAGDRFYPLGLGKSQKVKEFFINQKIDVLRKKEIPIVCNGDEIVWIAGMRLDERYRVHKTCKRIYRLKVNIEGKL